MKNSRIKNSKKAMEMSWSMIGWMIIGLVVLIVLIIIVVKSSGPATSVLDKLGGSR